MAFRAAFDRVADRPVAMAAGYARGGAAPVVLTRGVRFRGSDEAVGPQARWHIGSITKTFTATLLMRLGEAGVLDFDAPLASLLPEYADELHPDWATLTLPEILSHTAGLAANFTKAEMGAPYGDDLAGARLERLRAHWGAPLPGKRGAFEYSNLGYALAGHIAETRAGQPWEALIRSEIAAPLGLESLGFGPPLGADDPWGHRGLLGLRRPVAPDAPSSDNPAWLGPAGTIHLSLADLISWGQAHIRACRGELPALLSAEGCARLHKPVSQTYALGWGGTEMDLGDRRLSVQGHAGSNGLWIAQLFYSAEEDLVLALAINQPWIARSQKMLVDLAKALLAP